MKYLKQHTQINFPSPKDIVINMMPYVIGDHSSIPNEFIHYLDIIKACEIDRDELGKIGYLTIHESLTSNSTQRRSGVHTEKHPTLSWGGGSWGGFKGGLYLASNIQSTIAYDMYIKNPGKQGSVEGFKLKNKHILKPNVLYWMTDGTPHMGLKTSGYRQFFRLVTSNVSVWYREHSTTNRLGVQPSAKIIYTDKFAS